MQYSELLKRLNGYAEPTFADFQCRLIFTRYPILGVRTPMIRRLAKECFCDFEEIFGFPNEYYEVVFLKLAQVSALPYDKFVQYLPQCIALIDNWALCDSFRATSIKKNKEIFLPMLQTIFMDGGEYAQRYPLVVLLTEYIEERYFSAIEQFIQSATTERYYVHMAVAWLLAEILVKEYAYGVKLLQKGFTDDQTHDKAIQKAIESYRLTNEQKEYLRSLKIRK